MFCIFVELTTNRHFDDMENNENIERLGEQIILVETWIQSMSLQDLEESYKKMQDRVSRLDSMAFMAPNYHTQQAKIDFEKLQVKQLGLYVALRKNWDEIQTAKNAISEAQETSNKLAALFA